MYYRFLELIFRNSQHTTNAFHLYTPPWWLSWKSLLNLKKSAGVLAKANYIFTKFPNRCTNAYPSFHKPNGIWWLLRMEETPSQYLFYQLIATCQLHLALIKNEAIESFIKHSSCDCSRALLKSMKHCCLRDVSLTSFLKKLFFFSVALIVTRKQFCYEIFVIKFRFRHGIQTCFRWDINTR